MVLDVGANTKLPVSEDDTGRRVGDIRGDVSGPDRGSEAVK